MQRRKAIAAIIASVLIAANVVPSAVYAQGESVPTAETVQGEAEEGGIDDTSQNIGATPENNVTEENEKNTEIDSENNSLSNSHAENNENAIDTNTKDSLISEDLQDVNSGDVIENTEEENADAEDIQKQNSQENIPELQADENTDLSGSVQIVPRTSTWNGTGDIIIDAKYPINEAGFVGVTASWTNSEGETEEYTGDIQTRDEGFVIPTGEETILIPEEALQEFFYSREDKADGGTLKVGLKLRTGDIGEEETVVYYCDINIAPLTPDSSWSDADNTVYTNMDDAKAAIINLINNSDADKIKINLDIDRVSGATLSSTVLNALCESKKVLTINMSFLDDIYGYSKYYAWTFDGNNIKNTDQPVDLIVDILDGGKMDESYKYILDITPYAASIRFYEFGTMLSEGVIFTTNSYFGGMGTQPLYMYKCDAEDQQLICAGQYMPYVMGNTVDINNITSGAYILTDMLLDESESVIYPMGYPPQHSHSYESVFDDDNHWEECICGDKINVGAHTFEWVVDREATSEKTGLKHEECSVCGYEKKAIEFTQEVYIDMESAEEAILNLIESSETDTIGIDMGMYAPNMNTFILPKEVISELKESGKTLTINFVDTLDLDGSTEGYVYYPPYTWTFEGSKITAAEQDVNLVVHIWNKGDSAATDLVPSNIGAVVIDFMHNGALPKGTSLQINKFQMFFAGTGYLYHYNENINKLEYVGEFNPISAVDGSQYMVIQGLLHCSSYVLTDQRIPEGDNVVYPEEGRQHNYSQKYDTANHWMECECGDKINVEPHTFEWRVMKEATKTETGSREHICTVCGYVDKTETIPVLGKENANTSNNNTAVSDNTYAQKATAVNTADQSQMTGYLALLIVAMITTGGLLIIRKRKGYKNS